MPVSECGRLEAKYIPVKYNNYRAVWETLSVLPPSEVHCPTASEAILTFSEAVNPFGAM